MYISGDCIKSNKKSVTAIKEFCQNIMKLIFNENILQEILKKEDEK